MRTNGCREEVKHGIQGQNQAAKGKGVGTHKRASPSVTVSDVVCLRVCRISSPLFPVSQDVSRNHCLSDSFSFSLSLSGAKYVTQPQQQQEVGRPSKRSRQRKQKQDTEGKQEMEGKQDTEMKQDQLGETATTTTEPEKQREKSKSPESPSFLDMLHPEDILTERGGRGGKGEGERAGKQTSEETARGKTEGQESNKTEESREERTEKAQALEAG